jgi:uncharacterized membrane protein YfcA
MHLTLWQYGLGLFSGVLVGFALGLVGGGGSILATPLMVYLVGVRSPHLAIGTSAFAVAANAAANLLAHARRGTVIWRCATVFAAAGVLGALAGSSLGKLLDGRRLLALFAVLMIVVGALMLRARRAPDATRPGLTRRNAPRLAVAGGATGAVAGFFGIGGGFLIVPALIGAADMPILNAVGCSLVSVMAFGLTTAANYALAGWVDWTLAGVFLLGGVGGGLIGARLAGVLATRRDALNRVFATLIFAVAGYVLYRSLGGGG